MMYLWRVAIVFAGVACAIFASALFGGLALVIAGGGFPGPVTFLMLSVYAGFYLVALAGIPAVVAGILLELFRVKSLFVFGFAGAVVALVAMILSGLVFAVYGDIRSFDLGFAMPFLAVGAVAGIVHGAVVGRLKTRWMAK